MRALVVIHARGDPGEAIEWFSVPSPAGGGRTDVTMRTTTSSAC